MNRIHTTLWLSLFIAATSWGVHCQEPASDVTLSPSFVRDAFYGNAATFQVGLGDFDSDGDLDAVFANMNGASEIWINDGTGRFTNSGQFLGAYAHGVAIGDLDGDKDLDLAFAQASKSFSSQIYLNNGMGRFTPSRNTLADRFNAANAITLFDADLDGDLDAGVYYANRSNRVYLNDGTAQFEAFGPQMPGMACWGDVDGDGIVDAVIQRFEGGYSIQLGIGDGSFEESSVVDARTSFNPGSFALGDIDRDGDRDVVCASGDFERTSSLVLLLNDGIGKFSTTYVPQFLTSLSSVCLGDLDTDGDLDIFLGALERPNVIGINDGLGGFSDAGLLLGADVMEGISAMGDLDGDGDLDLFVAIYGQGGANEVWLNTTGE